MKEKDDVFIVVESKKITFGDLSAAWMIEVLERNGLTVVSVGALPGQEVVIIQNIHGALFFLEILREKHVIAIVQYWQLDSSVDLNNLDFLNEINEANRKAMLVKFTVEKDVLSAAVRSVIYFRDAVSESRLIEAIERHWADFVEVLTSTKIRSFIRG